MRLIFDVGHPAQVHLFRNAILKFLESGEDIKIVARGRGITYDLLDKYGIEYIKFPHSTSLLKKPISLVRGIKKLLKISKEFKPDLFISAASIQSAQVSALVDKPHISFGDSEVKKFSIYYFTSYIPFVPFTDVICTPIGLLTKPPVKKHIKYKGYHELAYLHPNWFKPDPKVLEELNLTTNDKFFILRFVSWGATHDIGQRGFSLEDKRKMIRELSRHGRVLITSESELTNDLTKYQLNISPEKIHDLLYYSSMYVGEGATMATEAGILGTPSIYISTLAGALGNFKELGEKYGLVYSFENVNQAQIKINELLENKNLKKDWEKKREKLLKDKIDVTRFMVNLIENYPESHRIMREKPSY